MNRPEIDERLTDTEHKITAQKQLITSLETQSENMAAQGDAKKVIATKKELTAARELLDGYELVLKSCQKTQTEYQEKREPEAAKIRKHLAEDLWPSALPLHEQVRAFQAGLEPVLEKITQMNNEFLALANEHKQLIDEKIWTPRIPIPQEIYAAAAVKLETLPKSLDVRLPTEREKDRISGLLQERRPIVMNFLKRSKIEEYPRCPACEAELLVQRYELSEDQSKGYLEMRCSKHGAMWLQIQLPGRPPLSAAGHPLPNAPVPLADVTGPAASKIQSHDLAPPGLTIEDEKQGGKKTK
jgi:hypothetical protein